MDDAHDGPYAREPQVEDLTRICRALNDVGARYILIGGFAAPISFYAIRLRQKWGLDESLDVWACHGMGGTWGALATGLFATTQVNAAGFDGLFYGNPNQLLVQAIAALVSIAFAFGVTFVITKLLSRFIGLRVTENEEEVGLDISEHGERAYA